MSEANHPTPEEMLESLRWRADITITNHEGGRVWLKECFSDDGRRLGITDCCPVEAPCDWHRALGEKGAV